jgi:Winged helix DNA-binding domain
MTTARDIARRRLRSQRLVAPHADSAAAVVEGLLAVQAENAGQAAWAVACRTSHPDASDLQTLLDRGEVIRTHVLRPTWHFVAADDVRWLLEVTAPRVRPVVVRQLTELHGHTAAELDRMTAALDDALSLQPDQTRDEVAVSLRERGVDAQGQRLMHLLAMAELDRLVCSGRPRDGTHTYARFVDRVPSPRVLARDEALAELALRYFTGHGPATERDLSYWATLTLGDVRRGLAQVRDQLASFDHEGRTFWHAPGLDEPDALLEPAGHLLQILDELYRGYQDSRMLLDADGVVPTGRETALGMAVVDGQMVARVKRTVGRRLVLELDPYRGTLTAAEQAALDEAAARYGAFLGLEHELVVA